MNSETTITDIISWTFANYGRMLFGIGLFAGLADEFLQLGWVEFILGGLVGLSLGRVVRPIIERLEVHLAMWVVVAIMAPLIAACRGMWLGENEEPHRQATMDRLGAAMRDGFQSLDIEPEPMTLATFAQESREGHARAIRRGCVSVCGGDNGQGDSPP